MPRRKQFTILGTAADMTELNKHLDKPVKWGMVHADVPQGTKRKPRPKKKKKPTILYSTLHNTMVSDMTVDQLLIAIQPDAKSRTEARRWIKLTKKPMPLQK